MRLCGVSGAIALQEPAEQVNRRRWGGGGGGGVLIVGMHVIMVQCPDLWVSRCLPAVRLCGLEIWRLRRSPPLRC